MNSNLLCLSSSSFDLQHIIITWPMPAVHLLLFGAGFLCLAIQKCDGILIIHNACVCSPCVPAAFLRATVVPPFQLAGVIEWAGLLPVKGSDRWNGFPCTQRVPIFSSFFSFLRFFDDYQTIHTAVIIIDFHAPAKKKRKKIEERENENKAATNLSVGVQRTVSGTQITKEREARKILNRNVNGIPFFLTRSTTMLTNNK